MKFKLDINEWIRKFKRFFDGDLKLSYRRLFLILICVTVIFLYIGPSIIRWLFRSPQHIKDPLLRCMDDRLTPFYLQNFEFDANIRHLPPLEPPFENDQNFIPYVGNGIFGLEIEQNAHLNIKSGRALTLPVYFRPIVSLSTKNYEYKESTVVEYLTGIVHRFQCFSDNFFVAYQYYAHRNMPSVFVQEIQITNTKNYVFEVDLVLPRFSATDWPMATIQQIKLQHGSSILEYQLITGPISLRDDDIQKIRAVSIVSRIVPPKISLKKRGVTKLEILTTVNYSEMISMEEYPKRKDIVAQSAIDAMKKALQEAEHEDFGNLYYNFRRQHIKVWNHLWETGFQISTSRAENALNGDRINATLYAVLSQVRSYEFEESITPLKKNEIARSLTYAEGCYDSYHTLQALNLWKTMDSLENLNGVVTSWMLTLEKQGCHNLIKAGASGVIQAMVLSFGSFRFSNQHLEFNIHPKYLHRDYFYRRLNYGNMTHVNVSVVVTEDNKAVMFVALDRSDGTYYACDAGCDQNPIQLGEKRIEFPVKLTEPLTAILYVTSDRQHMEELRHVIHVHEVNEMPAHEHHVIALHKHGHHLGGLPTLFWVSICAIIIIFHIFLCKLIVKEYCEPPDKIRYRYSKP